MLGVCRELLDIQKQKQDERKQLAGKWWQPLNGLEDLVFTSTDEKPVSREKVTSELDKILHKLQADHIGIPEFTFHALSHTFATRAIENGMKPQMLKEILGHSSLVMTRDLYAHVLPTTKAEEMELIRNAF